MLFLIIYIVLSLQFSKINELFHNLLGTGEISVYGHPVTASLFITLPCCFSDAEDEQRRCLRDKRYPQTRETQKGLCLPSLPTVLCGSQAKMGTGKSELWLILLPRRNRKGMNFKHREHFSHCVHQNALNYLKPFSCTATQGGTEKNKALHTEKPFWGHQTIGIGTDGSNLGCVYTVH